MSKGFTHSGYNDTVTYWGNPVEDGMGGKTFDAPVTIQARWTLKQEEFHTLQGELEVSQAIVHTQQELDVAGWVFRGTSTEASPYDVEGAYVIRQYVEVPDLRSVTLMRKVML